MDVYDGFVNTGGEVVLYDVSTPVCRDFVIGDDIRTDLIDFAITRNPATAKEQLVILHPFGSPDFLAAFSRIEAGVEELEVKPLNALPPFTAVPRNAALVMVFDDLLSDSTISMETVKLLVGNPPQLPFLSRVIPDLNHGDIVDLDGDDSVEFYSTRIVLDMTVSPFEALGSNPPLPVNMLGLPAAMTTTQPNCVLRIPTQTDPGGGQDEILTNVAGSGVAFIGNGPADPTSPTLDVLRAFRSGGDTQVTGDPYNGFLFDDVAPEIIGVQSMTIDAISFPAGAGDYDIDITFDSMTCAVHPDIGDVIETANNYLIVVEPRYLTPSTATAMGVPVQIIAGDPALFSVGLGQYLVAYDVDEDTPECFVRFTPEAGFVPSSNVSPEASLVMRFSEPMDPDSVLAFDNYVFRRDPTTAMSLLEEKIVSVVESSVDMMEFRSIPVTPLTHTVGSFEPYTFEVGRLEEGDADPVYVDLPTDLAGNELVDTTGEITFTLDPAAPTFQTNSKVFDFNVVNMDGDPGNPGAPVDYPEIRGMFLYDLLRGVIKPRPVSRFGAVADGSQPVVGAMVPYGSPIKTPLSQLGSKLMNVWRYHDVGFSLLDEANFDVDVEGLNWSPFTGYVQVDDFAEYRIALSHSMWLPDEYIDPTLLLPTYSQSGLVGTYDSNQLDASLDPLTVVHEKDKGYFLDPFHLFTSSTGTPMFPWPMNLGVPIGEYTYWTWRDTTIQAVGAPNGVGVDTARLDQVTGSATPTSYPAGDVPTIGLPMLMEFRCYPDDFAGGLNGLAVALAISSSSRPNFRAFSTGGIDQGGTTHKIDPDSEPVATGGYDPSGAKTPGTDNTFYIGQVDFVVRVSRVVSKWLDVGAGYGAIFVSPVVEPTLPEQPSGTQVVLAFRGATTVTSSGGGGWSNRDQENADNYDAYGNTQDLNGGPTGCGCTITPTFLNADATWKSDMSEIDTARFFQFRATFVSNTETLLTPEISALGFAYFLN